MRTISLAVYRLATFALVLASAQPVAAQIAPGPVHITGCAITKPRPFSHHPTGTQIAFVNTGPTLLHRITFAVTYRSGDQTYDRTVEDTGIFAPNTPVDHHYSLYSDITYAGSMPLACKVASAS